MTPGKLATIFPMTLATSLIHLGFPDFSSASHSYLRPMALSRVSLIVIVTEFMRNLTVTISCGGLGQILSDAQQTPKSQTI